MFGFTFTPTDKMCMTILNIILTGLTGTDESASILSNTAELREADDDRYPLILTCHIHRSHASYIVRTYHTLFASIHNFFLHFCSNYMPLCIEFKFKLNLRKLSFHKHCCKQNCQIEETKIRIIYCKFRCTKNCIYFNLCKNNHTNVLLLLHT